jgi:selenocysteine-specific elongation factor
VQGWLQAAGLAALDTRELPVRLGLPPSAAARLVAGLGSAVLRCGDLLVSRAAAAAEGARLGGLVKAYHEAHPLDPGMSLQALRAAMVGPNGGSVASPVADAVCDTAVQDGHLVVAGAVVHRPGWSPTFDAHAGAARDRLRERLIAARWEVPTIAELEREFPGSPVRALLAHLQRDGGVEAVDAERVADAAALRTFRAALDAAIAASASASATPAELRERLGLTRKYLIPLLEWADRQGITRRQGDGRTLARLTAPRAKS